MVASSRTANLSDEELMRLVQSADDRRAFAALYDRYAPKALSLARSICVSRTRAEEAVQEGFLSIWRGRSRFDFGPAGGSFRAWSMTIIRHSAIDAVRHDQAEKRPRHSPEETEAIDLRVRSPENEVIDRHEADALRHALAELPEAQAEVIGLAFFGELTHAEIAQRLELPAGTVKGRMRLGLEKLRQSVDSET
jgi:RNA polymerase sigma-70 factor, ECF subfamily